MRRWLPALATVVIAAVMGGMPGAHADWPFPDTNPLPILRDDAFTELSSASYQITVTDTAEFEIDTAATATGGRVVSGLANVFPVGHPEQGFMFTFSGSSASPTRVRVVSDPLALNLDTEPVAAGDSAIGVGILGPMAAGTYGVTLMAGANEGTTASLFRIHGDSGVTVDGANFGGGTIGNIEAFHGTASVTASYAAAAVQVTKHVDAEQALTGIFSVGEIGAGNYTDPAGASHDVSLLTAFSQSAAGSYDFNITLDVELLLTFPALLIVADVLPPVIAVPA